MSTKDIRSRHWTDAEKQAIRSASKARATGLDLLEKEYKDTPRLTGEQLARLVRPRKARRKVAVSVRLDPQVLDWLRAQGKGPRTFKLGRRLYVLQGDLREWLDRMAATEGAS